MFHVFPPSFLVHFSNLLLSLWPGFAGLRICAVYQEGREEGKHASGYRSGCDIPKAAAPVGQRVNSADNVARSQNLKGRDQITAV